MLKKSVVANIMPAERRCKCGVTGSINPTALKTYCSHCNELLYDNTIVTAAVAESVVEPIVTQDEEPSNEDSQLTSEDTGTAKPDATESSDEQKDDKPKKASKSWKRSLLGG